MTTSQTEYDGAKTRTEALIIVARASPCREAIPQEVIVSLALWSFEHLNNDREPLVASSSLLQVGIDFLLGRRLGDLDTGRLAFLIVVLAIVGNEDLAGLVGVQFARLFAVGFGQFVLRCAGLDTKEVVEGDVLFLQRQQPRHEDGISRGLQSQMSAQLAGLAGCVYVQAGNRQ